MPLNENSPWKYSACATYFRWLLPFSVGRSCQQRCKTVVRSPPPAKVFLGLQLTSWKTNRATNVQDQGVVLPNEAKDPGGQRCKKYLCGQELLECTADVEMEWKLFKAGVASTSARVFGRKRIGGASNDKKVNPWWNQGEKDAIQAKKVDYKAWFQNKAASSFASAVRWGAKIRTHYSEEIKNVILWEFRA